MTKAEKIREEARQLICGMRTEALIEVWEKTSELNTPDIPMVRGWLMDEFERRFPKAYDKWLDESAEDMELRNYIDRIAR